MNKESVQKLTELISDIKTWNENDIICFEDLSPTLEMLRAREEVIDSAMKELKELI